MIETFYGNSEMPIGILIDRLGTYLVLSTLGIAVAALFSSETSSGAGVLKRICTFPPFIALFVSLLLLPVEYPQWSVAVLRRLGDTLAPLALVSVGLQLRLDQLSGIRMPAVDRHRLQAARRSRAGNADIRRIVARSRGCCEDNVVRIRDGTNDWSLNRSYPARPQSATYYSHGGPWHYSIFSIPTALVVRVAGCLNERARVRQTAR